MNVLVIAAGILDPKWPLTEPPEGRLPARTEDKLVLSPFEESALELALRIRDGRPETTVISAVTLGAATEKLARDIGSYNIADVTRLDLDMDRLWDAPAIAGAIVHYIAALPDTPPLILAGRELGDCDDGLLAPLLSAGLARRFFGLAQEVRLEGGCVAFVRERGAYQEVAALTADLLVSVTNDRRNKLRRPLMKNVQAAKRAIYPVAPAGLPEGAGATLQKTTLRASAPADSLPQAGGAPARAGHNASGNAEGRRAAMTLRLIALSFPPSLSGLDAPYAAVAAARGVQESSGAPFESVHLGEHPPAGAHAIFAHPALSPDSPPEHWAIVASEALRERIGANPTLVLLPPGPFSDEFAAYFASATGLRPLGRCEALSIDGARIHATRVTHGGRLQCTMAIEAHSVIAIMRAPHDAAAEPASTGGAPHARILQTPLAPALAIARHALDARKAALEGARIVVSGGRGLDEAGFQLLDEIADRLGGALGASLQAIDLGLAPVSRQVGQSGKFVTPRIYLAVGLSGTPQHLAGIGAATRIVAINKDPDAPIFDFSELGIVADWREALPLLRDALNSHV